MHCNGQHYTWCYTRRKCKQKWNSLITQEENLNQPTEGISHIVLCILFLNGLSTLGKNNLNENSSSLLTHNSTSYAHVCHHIYQHEYWCSFDSTKSTQALSFWLTIMLYCSCSDLQQKLILVFTGSDSGGYYCEVKSTGGSETFGSFECMLVSGSSTVSPRLYIIHN